ncbi:hypothetical protein [Salinigranum salinum]|nr:hypothetical protein [Salinigranum salinum]
MTAESNGRADTIGSHVERALRETEDPEVRYHLRQALQFLEE